jgi:hypothetical protein
VLPPVGLSHLLDKSLQANKTVELIYQFVLDLLPSNLLENEFFFYGSFVCPWVRACMCVCVCIIYLVQVRKKLSFGVMRGDMLSCMLLLYQFLLECRYWVVFILNPKGLAQVVRALVLVAFPSGLRFESPWVQTILWGQPGGKAWVLSDPCRGGALHRFEVYTTEEGFLGIKNKKLSLYFDLFAQRFFTWIRLVLMISVLLGIICSLFSIIFMALSDGVLIHLFVCFVLFFFKTL